MQTLYQQTVYLEQNAVEISDKIMQQDLTVLDNIAHIMYAYSEIYTALLKKNRKKLDV